MKTMTATVEKDMDERDSAIRTLHKVLERENSLSRCCAVRALEQIRACDEETVNRLLSALHEDSDPDVRMDAAAALGRMKIKDAVDSLLKTLREDPEGDVRVQAVIALSKIKSDRAVDDLIKCIKEDGYIEFYDEYADDLEFAPAWEVQSQALDALGEIGDDRATDSVIELLKDEEYEDLQEKGFRVLAKLSSERAAEFLLDQLKNGGRLARRRSAKALIDFNGGGDEGSEISPDLLEGLTNALLDEDADVRIYAARALSETDMPQIIVPLTMLLSDPDGEVRKEAAGILGAMRGKAVTDRLIKLMNESDVTVKLKIVEVLGDIGDPEAADEIAKFLGSGDPELLYEAVRALGKIGVEGSEDRITEILDDQKSEKNVRVQAAWALGRILKGKGKLAGGEGEAAEGGETEEEPETRPGVVDVLIKRSFDENDTVCIASMAALSQIDPVGSVETISRILLGDIEGEERPGEETSGELVEHTEEEGASPPELEGKAKTDEETLVEILGDGDVAPRKEEVSTLASIMVSQATRDARELAGKMHRMEAEEKAQKKIKKSSRIRAIAASLLGETKSPEAVDALIQGAEDESLEVQRESVISLGRIGDGKAVAAVLGGLDSESRDVRLAAVDALQGFGGHKEICEHIDGLICDPDYFVRERAVHIIGTMEGSEAADLLSKALDDEEMVVRREALNCIAECGMRNAEFSSDDFSAKIGQMIFDHAGELRRESARALKRLDDLSAAEVLLDRLNDAEHEEAHWICIDALAELYAEDKTVH